MIKKISETKVRAIVRNQLQIKKLNELHNNVVNEEGKRLNVSQAGARAELKVGGDIQTKLSELKGLPRAWLMNSLPHIIDGLASGVINKPKFEMALAKLGIDKSVIVTQAASEEGE
jgi:hypothetical protein